MNKTGLQFLSLAGTTLEDPVLGPLAVLHHDNWLFIMWKTKPSSSIFNIYTYIPFQVFKCSDGIVFAHKIILVTACPLIAKAVELGNLANEELVQVTKLSN